MYIRVRARNNNAVKAQPVVRRASIIYSDSYVSFYNAICIKYSGFPIENTILLYRPTIVKTSSKNQFKSFNKTVHYILIFNTNDFPTIF